MGGPGIEPAKGLDVRLRLGFNPSFSPIGTEQYTLSGSKAEGLKLEHGELELGLDAVYMHRWVEAGLGAYATFGTLQVPTNLDNSLAGEKGSSWGIGGRFNLYFKPLDNLGIGGGVKFGNVTLTGGKTDLGGAFPFEFDDQSYLLLAPFAGLKAYIGPAEIEAGWQFKMAPRGFRVEGYAESDPGFPVQSALSHGPMLNVGVRFVSFACLFADCDQQSTFPETYGYPEDDVPLKDADKPKADEPTPKAEDKPKEADPAKKGDE